jgi:hypothetical protein
MSRYLVQFSQSLLGGLGLLWLFLEAFYGLNPSKPPAMGFLAFLALGILIGIFWFVVDGLWISGFLQRSIKITSNAIDTAISIKFGDLIAQEGCKAISVNEYFDSTVDGQHVSSNSLHGIMLTRFWPGNINDWDRQVDEDLADVTPLKQIVTRPAPGKQVKYAIGTTARTCTNGQEFLCVSLTRTNTETLQASATSKDLHLAIRGLLRKARRICGGNALNIPLIGSGLARTGIKPNIIVDLILLAIFEESKKQKVTNDIRIILPISMRKSIDLTTIQKDWR